MSQISRDTAKTLEELEKEGFDISELYVIARGKKNPKQERANIISFVLTTGQRKTTVDIAEEGSKLLSEVIINAFNDHREGMHAIGRTAFYDVLLYEGEALNIARMVANLPTAEEREEAFIQYEQGLLGVDLISKYKKLKNS